MVARVDQAEAEGRLEHWCQEDAPTAVIPQGQEPKPGSIDGRKHWPELDATVLQLGNGMKVRSPPSADASHQALLVYSLGVAAVLQKSWQSLASSGCGPMTDESTGEVMLSTGGVQSHGADGRPDYDDGLCGRRPLAGAAELLPHGLVVGAPRAGAGHLRHQA